MRRLDKSTVNYGRAYQFLRTNKKAREYITRLVEAGASTAEIRKGVKAEFAGMPWLDLLIELLPLIVEILKKILG